MAAALGLGALVALATELSTDDSPRFVNGLLANNQDPLYNWGITF